MNATALHLNPSTAIPAKTFSPLVIQFLDYLRLEKHFSDYTVKSYGADLVQFSHFLSGQIGHAAAAGEVPGETVAAIAPKNSTSASSSASR